MLNVETPTFAAVLLAILAAVLGRGAPAQFVAALAALREGAVTGRAVIVLWMAWLGIPRRHREDATQDTLEAALKAWDRFDPDRQRDQREGSRKGRPIFAAWMNAISVNVAGHWRDRAYLRREVLSPNPMARRVADPRPLALEVLAGDEERNELLARLVEFARVDPRGAQVVIGHDLEERSMDEVADAIGVPRSTAYKIRARALIALRNVPSLSEEERDRDE